MRLQAFVRTIVRCRCGHESRWCVRVEHEVPHQLRCVPGGGAPGGTGLACQLCGDGALAVTELERLVAAALHGHDVDRWIRAGAVVITC